jgi:hypothetical protein
MSCFGSVSACTFFPFFRIPSVGHPVWLQSVVKMRKAALRYQPWTRKAGVLSGLVWNELFGGTVGRTMSKRQKQTAFLKTLILHGNVEDRLQLHERIKRAEREEQCAWRAFLLVSLLALFSCVGLCYSAVLIPEFFQNSSHIIVRFFSGLGLASLISAVAFLGFWIWCRAVLNRVQEECRRFVMTMLEPHGRTRGSHLFIPNRTELKSETHASVGDRGASNSESVLPAYQTYSELFRLRRLS